MKTLRLTSGRLSGVAALLMALFILCMPLAQIAIAQTDPDLPNPPIKLETLPNGSIVVPMDHDLQNNSGTFTYFDIRAYGLVNRWLHAGIPVKWVIRTGKLKDELDFNANAERVRPTAIASASVAFKGGAFVVLPEYAQQALDIAVDTNTPAAGYFQRVHLYRLTADVVNADVRYTLLHKPKVSVSGSNSGIHTAILNSAGFISGTHYSVQLASVLPGQCFTIHTEPHTSPSTSEVVGLETFVQLGGNAFLQCEAVVNYENLTNFQTTNGIVSANNDNALSYLRPDLALSQFTGDLNESEGGSVTDWQFAAGSGYHNQGHSHAVESVSSRIQMSQSKVNGINALGSNVFYLGGHQYANSNLKGVNGQRALLNAIFVPAQAVNCPDLFIINITGRVFIDQNLNGVLDGAEGGFAGVTVTLTGPNNVTIVVTTDENGYYTVGIPSSNQFGDWTVTVTEPSEWYITSNNQGQTVTVDGTITNVEAVDVGLGTIIAVDDFFSTPINTPLSGDVSGNDIYETGSTFSIVTGPDPTHGSVTMDLDGTFTFTPEPDFNGTATFTYEVCAPSPNETVCDTATVTITIADLEILKSNSPDVDTPVEPGDMIEYTITVTNTGSAFLDGVNVIDAIPAGTVYVPNSVTFNINNPTLTYGALGLTSEVFTTTGANTWTAPAGVTQVIVEMWGGGGASRNGTDNRGGAGGGGYARSVLNVTPNTLYNLNVGAGGVTSQQAGGNSWFNTTATIQAGGGVGGADNAVNGGTANVGDVIFAGGGGGGRGGTAGGGGGGSATPFGAGVNGQAGSGTTGGLGGAGQGDGGNGGNEGQTGQAGQIPGGGAGGSGGGNESINSGGNGQVIIYYIPAGTTDNPSSLASNWTLLPEAVLTVTYQVEVSNPPTEAVILNTATVSSNQLPDIDSNEVVNVVAPVAVFDEFTTPKDTELLGDVSLNDIYPPGATFSISDQSGITHGSLTVNPNGTFSYTPGAGETAAVSFVYQVCAAAPYENVCDTETVYITIADLEITKSNNPDENTNVNPGDTITYTIVVKNTGSSTLTNISVEDVLPAGLTYVPGTVSALPTIFTDVFNASGTWTAPNGVTSIDVQAWGAGGGTDAGNDNRGGGGGGAYAGRNNINVTPNQSYSVTVGSGGVASGTAALRLGGDSWFGDGTLVLARGGIGGTNNGGAGGGVNPTSIGAVTLAGGTGGNRNNNAGGGGGGSALTNAIGGAGGAGSGDVGGAGGIGEGNGGKGGDNVQEGQNGFVPGGGGGGSGKSFDSASNNTGRGADGRVIVSYSFEGTTGAPPNLASGWKIVPGAELTITFDVVVDDPVTQSTFVNFATVSSDQFPDTQSNEVLNPTSFNNTYAINDINQTPVNVPVSGNVLTNDFDLQGDIQTVTSITYITNLDGDTATVTTLGTPIDIFGYDDNGDEVAAGTITLNADGSYTYTPATGFTGTVPLTYTNTDNNTNPATDSATLTIKVTEDTPGVNDPPLAQDDTAITEEGVTVSGNVMDNDSDPDGDPITVTSATYLAANGDETPLVLGTPTTIFDEAGNVAGEITLNADGTWNFVPEPGFTGDVPVEYTIEDVPGGLTDNATLTITVVPDTGNQTFANDDANLGLQGETLTGNILTNDFDPEGDTQSVTGIDTNGNGTPNQQPVAGTPYSITQNNVKIGELTIDPATGAYTWVPEPDFVGTAVVAYEVCDNGTPQACATATLYLTNLETSFSIDLTGGPCWRTLSSPFQLATYADILAGLWTQGVPGASFSGGEPNVLIWPNVAGNDQADWVIPGNMNDIVPPGTGFIVSIFADDNFNGIDDPFPKTITLSGTPHAADVSPVMNTNPGGFTLVGNPFASSINFGLVSKQGLTNVAYVYDRNTGGPPGDNAGGWITTDGTIGDVVNGNISPLQGFFVQNDAIPPPPSRFITFTEASKIAGNAQFYGKEQDQQIHAIRLQLEGQDLNNSAWIRFSNRGNNGLGIGDAYQFYPFGKEYAILGARKGESVLDIGQYNLGEEEYSIPLHMEATRAGRYTITASNFTLPAGQGLLFHDLLTGEIMPLTSDFSYTFELRQTAKANPALDMTCGMSVQEMAKQLLPTQAKAIGTTRFVIRSAGGSYGDGGQILPREYRLRQNYPNPFNPSTQITFELPVQSDVRVMVYDITGRMVASLAEGMMQAGSHTVSFNAENLSSGVYIYRLQAGGVVLTRKLTLLK